MWQRKYFIFQIEGIHIFLDFITFNNISFHLNQSEVHKFSKLFFIMEFLTRNSSFILIALVCQHLSCIVAFNPFLETTAMDYMSSAYAVRNLAVIEQKVLNALIEYKNSIENRLEAVNSYMDDVLSAMENSKTGLRKIRNISLIDLDEFARETSDHMFKSLKTIQRFASGFPSMENAVQNDKPEKQFQSSIEMLRNELQFPVVGDVIQSRLSIVRLKQTYNLTVSQMMEGDLKGLKTNSGLDLDGIFEFGFMAFRLQMYPMCFEFLEETLKLARQEGNIELLDRTEALLNTAITKHDIGLISGKFVKEENPFHFVEKLYGYNNDSFRLKVPFNLKPNIHNLSDPVGIQTAFGSLCSGEDLRHPSVTKQFKCKLRAEAPYFLLQPLKIEEMNHDPFIIIVHDVLSNNEIDKLLKIAKPNLKRSRVNAKGETAEVDFARTSTNTWFQDYEPTSPFQFISKKVEMITGLRVNYLKASEDLQVANYGPGGLYSPHYDAAKTLEEFNADTLPLIEERGDRIATFMFYLSEVLIGGGTAFPALGISVQPSKGSAVFWYNLKNDVSLHLRTLHGGCPVLHGSKWIANKWIRAHEQMFISKCLSDKL